MNIKIQFIVCGWWYNNTELINQLDNLQNVNDNINVFWACHKEPIPIVQEKFDWKLFPNYGKCDGAYQDATIFLDIKDTDFVIFIHDDIVVKDLSFIDITIAMLRSKKFVGNYIGMPMLIDPNISVDDWVELPSIIPSYDYDPEIGTKLVKEWASPITRDMFEERLIVMTITNSMIACQFGNLKLIGGFEPRSGFQILQSALLGYKITKVYGSESIGYLSNKMDESIYIGE